MKKSLTLIYMLLFITAISSCTPEAAVEQTQSIICCGDDGNIPPPPIGEGN